MPNLLRAEAQNERPPRSSPRWRHKGKDRPFPVFRNRKKEGSTVKNRAVNRLRILNNFWLARIDAV
jgi:hypothetical protein